MLPNCRANTLFGLVMACLVFWGCESSLVRQVSYYEKTRNVTGARKVLEGAVADEPANPEALFLLGKLNFEHQEYRLGTERMSRSRKASTRYETEIKYLVSVHLSTTVKAGNEAYKSEDWSEAAQQFTYATIIDSLDPQLWLALGAATFQEGKFEASKAAYKNALQLNTESVSALLNLSEIALREERFADAEQLALSAIGGEGAIVSDMGNEKLFYARFFQNELEGANEAFNAVPSGKASLLLGHNHAVANVNANLLDEAAKGLKRLSASVDDKLTDGLYSRLLGEVYYKQRRYDEMAKLFETVVKQWPNDLDARRNLIIAYDLIGFKAEAATVRNELRALESRINPVSK